MIAHLRGKLIYKQPGQAIVEAAGVGYDVTISVPTFTALPAVGAEASLHIHTQVSEDQIALFGFLETRREAALRAAHHGERRRPQTGHQDAQRALPERTVQAIRAQDHAQLTRIPGVGKKLAERLVVELKDKLDDFAVAPVQTAVQARPWTMCFRRSSISVTSAPAAEKAIEQAIAKDKALAADFDGLFRGALKVIR